MDISNLTESDWHVFEQTYKAAAAFLRARSLTREYQALSRSRSRGVILRPYEMGRLTELEKLYGQKETRSCCASGRLCFQGSLRESLADRG